MSEPSGANDISRESACGAVLFALVPTTGAHWLPAAAPASPRKMRPKKPVTPLAFGLVGLIVPPPTGLGDASPDANTTLGLVRSASNWKLVIAWPPLFRPPSASAGRSIRVQVTPRSAERNSPVSCLPLTNTMLPIACAFASGALSVITPVAVLTPVTVAPSHCAGTNTPECGVATMAIVTELPT